jgi:hypothetical protein
MPRGWHAGTDDGNDDDPMEYSEPMPPGKPRSAPEGAGERERAKIEAPAPELPSHAADGTDLTLVRWMLDKSHAERLEVLQSGARSLAFLLDARPRR